MNMSYCRFQNTLIDIVDCESALNELAEEQEALSADEYYAMVSLLERCSRIAASYPPDAFGDSYEDYRFNHAPKDAEGEEV